MEPEQKTLLTHHVLLLITTVVVMLESCVASGHSCVDCVPPCEYAKLGDVDLLFLKN